MESMLDSKLVAEVLPINQAICTNLQATGSHSVSLNITVTILSRYRVKKRCQVLLRWGGIKGLQISHPTSLASQSKTASSFIPVLTFNDVSNTDTWFHAKNN